MNRLIFLGSDSGIEIDGRLQSDMIPNEVDRFLRGKDINREIRTQC